MAPSMAEYICIAAGEKFQPARANARPFCGIAAAFLRHCSHVLKACRRDHGGCGEREAAACASHNIVPHCKACAGRDCGDVGRAQLGSTICCTVFEIPPSGGGLKTWIETARYPMIPAFCAGPGAK